MAPDVIEPIRPASVSTAPMPAPQSVRLLILLSSLFVLAQAEPSARSHSGQRADPAGERPLTPAEEELTDEPELAIAARFDTKGDHLVDPTERAAARDFLATQPPQEALHPSRRPGTPPRESPTEPTGPGAKVNPPDVSAPAKEAPLYDSHTVRTSFLDFSEADWEAELRDFARTDIFVPARLRLDGHSFADVGVHFRPAGPHTVTEPGYKRSLRLVLDHAHPDQSLSGQKELLLLAPQDDATLVRSALYLQAARDFLTAPQWSFVRLVINGEDWGTYLSLQPFDAQFIQQQFGTERGARWEALPGATLGDLGPEPAAYRQHYQLRTAEDPSAWAALARLCSVLNHTPLEKLEAELAPLLDIDGVLRLLALENTLVNQDGYWRSGGGYGLYLDPTGRFHLTPREAGTVLQYPLTAEYVRDGGSTEEHPTKAPTRTEPTPQEIEAIKRSREAPRQASTDLAMMLSYTLVLRADRNDDSQLTSDELTDFARSWFIIMDEDSMGALTLEQFTAGFRLFLTPPSVRDGKSRQTFGNQDAAALIARDLFKAMDRDGDGQVTREEFTAAFAAWHAAWSEPKTKLLGQEALDKGLRGLLTQTVFAADQSVATRGAFIVQDDRTGAAAGRNERDEGAGRGGRGTRGGRGGAEGSSEGGGAVGSSMNVAGIPIRLGQGGRSGGGATRTVIYHAEDLSPLHGVNLADRPLLSRLLAVPELRKRYLIHVWELTERWLRWTALEGPAKEYRDLLVAELKQETHKSTSYARFVQEFDQESSTAAKGDDSAMSLKAFVAKRHDALLGDINVRHAIGAQ
jgi:Ca2+-binding EF-hand superfamily protein